MVYCIILCNVNEMGVIWCIYLHEEQEPKLLLASNFPPSILIDRHNILILFQTCQLETSPHTYTQSIYLQSTPDIIWHQFFLMILNFITLYRTCWNKKRIFLISSVLATSAAVLPSWEKNYISDENNQRQNAIKSLQIILDEDISL